MQTLYVFGAGVLIASAFAARDCTLWPGQAQQAWRGFRTADLALVWIAFAFLAVNLARFGPGESAYLTSRTIQMLGLAALSTLFFCGGWVWVARAGHVGLVQRFRRRMAGLPAPNPWRAALETLALAAGIIIFSEILMRLTQPLSPLRDLLNSPENLDLRSGCLFLLILVAPIWEEIVFRWYLPNRLEETMAPRRWARVAAIVLSSALWALGHANWTDPAWVKVAQIFAIGCLLSWRFRVIGLSGCLMAHLALNSTTIPKLLELMRAARPPAGP